MAQLPTTLSEAKRLGAKRYFTGKPCPHGHRVARLTSNRTCTACNQQQLQDWLDRHRQLGEATSGRGA